jgi:AraC family transcriptional regulator
VANGPQDSGAAIGFRKNDQANFSPSPYSDFDMSVTSKVLWYIESHLGGDLSLETIAQDLGVSRFHLSRAFGAALGCPLATFVRSRRLTEAAKTLTNGAPCITTVALDAGYGSHEAFTRAFRQQFGLTPEQVRSQAHVDNLKLKEPLRMQANTTVSVAPVRIAERDEILIFGLSQHYHCKNNAGIPSQWERFTPFYGNIPRQVPKLAYGVCYNFDDAGNFDYLCGVEVTEFPPHPVEFSRLRVAPQTYAVFEHTGHISAIGSTWNAIWNQGLSDAGLKAADAPVIELYHDDQFDPRSGNGGLELWVSVKSGVVTKVTE